MSTSREKAEEYQIHWMKVFLVTAPVSFGWGLNGDPVWWVVALSSGILGVVVNHLFEMFRTRNSLNKKSP